MIAWFTKNSIAANLLAAAIIGMGLYPVFTNQIPVEFFPSTDPDVISVRVPYRGSTPVEVETAVVIRVEEAVQDLEGIQKITSTANEGSGTVRIEVQKGYEPRLLLEDVKNRVNTINTFPVETENPQISLAQRTFPSIGVAIYGDLNEAALRRLAERVREDLLATDEITQAQVSGTRPYEISIEVEQETLEEYGLSFGDIAGSIRSSSLDLAAGSIKTDTSEILLRTKGQAYEGTEFADIVIRSDANGSVLRVGDVARVSDGFEETPSSVNFNGEPAIFVDVTVIGKQSILRAAESVREYVASQKMSMPPGVTIEYWQDRSRVVDARLNTLLNSAATGIILVFAVLTLFLRPALALWVCFGIPLSFMGAIALMPYTDTTINIISLFGFILVLGIVVDDAIVTGESIFSRIQSGMPPEEAAVVGTKDVATPVTLGVLTTMVAFIPLTMMEAGRGPIFAQITIIVIPVLLFSLVESKLILPAHLKHLSVGHDRSKMNPLMRAQRAVADGLERFVEKVYKPFLALCMRHRYTTMGVFVFIAFIVFGMLASGKLRSVFFPRIDTEYPSVSLVMPLGTAPEITARHVDRMEQAAIKLREEYTDPDTGESIVEVISSVVGATRPGRGTGQSHLGGVSFQLMPPEVLPEVFSGLTSRELMGKMRRYIGVIPGAEELSFRASIGRGGEPVDVQLSGPSFEDLAVASEQIRDYLFTVNGLFDIKDSFQNGKQEIKLQLRPEAEAFGITLNDLTRQARQSFFGLEAQRIQRVRDDVRVMIRFPLDDRRSIEDLRNMKVQTPRGGTVPFDSVAEMEIGRGFSAITRVDRNRTINVTADLDATATDVDAVLEDLRTQLPGIVDGFSGMRYSLEGEEEERRDSARALFQGIILVMFLVYALMAIATKSYIQPIIVFVTTIPFGVAGALLGHIIVGESVSQLSQFGMLALFGVAVNDSIVFLDYINKRLKSGMSLFEAVNTAGAARFRAIILTSLTTFMGLTPLLLEQSTQAQFLKGMAVSLGFGIVFTTFVTLILLPINFIIFNDIGRLLKGAWRAYWSFGEPKEDEVPAVSMKAE